MTEETKTDLSFNKLKELRSKIPQNVRDGVVILCSLFLIYFFLFCVIFPYDSAINNKPEFAVCNATAGKYITSFYACQKNSNMYSLVCYRGNDTACGGTFEPCPWDLPNYEKRYTGMNVTSGAWNKTNSSSGWRQYWG